MTTLDPDRWRRIRDRAPEEFDAPLWGPLIGPAARDGFVLGRIAQSLDGYIALPNGESRWIGGQADLEHTHRLRALCDAVVVGAGTVAMDDPRLTTRLVPGPSPVRVVIDPKRRLPAERQIFLDGPETLLLCSQDAEGPDRLGRAEVLRLPSGPDGIGAADILRALRARGLKRIFVEGGGVTVSRFLTTGALDRLHVTVAPLAMGAGIPGFAIAPPARLADGLRMRWTVHALGEDVLFDIPLERRVP